jgi:hypothetical protein
MKNIYDWYLSDSTAQRVKIEEKLNIFKKTGYKKTGEAFYDEGIEFLPERPMVVLTPELHYFRNKLNIEYEWNDFEELNRRLPEEYRWEKMSAIESSMHQNTATEGKPNKKYVSFDGYFEAVYSYDGILLNEETAPIDMGTYNYNPSTAWKRKHKDELDIIDTFDLEYQKDIAKDTLDAMAGHGVTDVVTYEFLANSEEDLKERSIRNFNLNNKYRYR